MDNWTFGTVIQSHQSCGRVTGMYLGKAKVPFLCDDGYDAMENGVLLVLSADEGDNELWPLHRTALIDAEGEWEVVDE